MIVAFSGKRGVGKDTAADVLCRELGFERIGLADPMKRFVGEVFDFTYEQLWGPSARREAIDPRWGKTPRELLQTLGTEWGRNMGHPDVWVRHLVRKANQILDAGRKRGIVVTDVRFENELRVLAGAGAHVIRILRPQTRPEASDGATAAAWSIASQHASEVALDGLPTTAFDAVIHNVSSLADFEAQVRVLVKGFPAR